VLDVLLLVEWAWCAMLLRARGLQLAVLCSGGVVASTYVAARLSTWMAKTFTPPTSPVFQWLQSNVSTRPDTVAALSGFAPAQAVAAGGPSLPHVLAFHILQVLFYLAITGAVFLLFVMVWHFSNVFWDADVTEATDRVRAATTVLSVGCGAYLAILTAIFLANIAWLRGLPFLASATAHSLGMQGVAALMHQLDVL
jgi:hypothetical protein